MTTVWWKIEALIPGENAIGGKPYWTQLNGDNGHPYRTCDIGDAYNAFRHSCHYHEKCRLVRVTEEVSEQQDRFPVDAHGCSG